MDAKRKAELLSIIVYLVDNANEETPYKADAVSGILELSRAVGINIVKGADVYENEVYIGSYLKYVEE